MGTLGSKLTYHVLTLGRAARPLEIARSVRLPGLVLCDPGSSHPVPGTPVLARDTRLSDQAFQRYVDMGAAGAAPYYCGDPARGWSGARLKWLETRWAPWQQVGCEPLVDTPERCRNLAAFTVALLDLAHADDLGLGIYALSRGTPQLRRYDPASTAVRDLLPGIQAMTARDALVLHNYGYWPLLDGADALLCRHESLAAELAEYGVTMPPTILAEYGYDSGLGVGWRGMNIREADYIAALRAGNATLKNRPYILFAAIYSSGVDSTLDKKWLTFESSTAIEDAIADEARRDPPLAVSWLVTPTPTPVPQPEVSVSIPIDGRLMSVEQFRAHVAGLDLARVKRVVIHHTHTPDETTWREWRGWDYWAGAIQREYERRGWTKGPHLFVSYEGVGLFFDMTKTGRAVGGGALEEGCLHVEVVGSFMTAVPQGATLANAVGTAAILIAKTGAALSNHQRVLGKAYECPGLALQAAWPWFAGLVSDAVKVLQTPVEMEYLPEEVEAEVWDAIQQHIIPLNPDAALEKAAAARGFLPASDEVRDVPGIVAQAFRDAKDRTKQHIAYCLEGHWDDVRWIEGTN